MRLPQQISPQCFGNHSLPEANLAILQYPFLHQHFSEKPEGILLLPVVLHRRAGSSNLLPWWPLPARFQPLHHGANVRVKLSLHVHQPLHFPHAQSSSCWSQDSRSYSVGILLHTSITVHSSWAVFHLVVVLLQPSQPLWAVLWGSSVSSASVVLRGQCAWWISLRTGNDGSGSQPWSTKGEGGRSQPQLPHSQTQRVTSTPQVLHRQARCPPVVAGHSQGLTWASWWHNNLDVVENRANKGTTGRGEGWV